MIPFCPDCRKWRTEKNEVVTVSEVLANSDWNGTHIQIIGSQKDDYTGATSLFEVTMCRDLALKFFGTCRTFSAELHDEGEINVADRDHLIRWARKNGIKQREELKARYAEYKRLFPQNCLRGQSCLRISAYTPGEIFTHDEAALIVELFESVLFQYSISVPSPEDDERGEDNDIGLYGSTYSDLLDMVEASLVSILERHSPGAEIVKDVFSGTV